MHNQNQLTRHDYERNTQPITESAHSNPGSNRSGYRPSQADTGGTPLPGAPILIGLNRTTTHTPRS